MNNSIAAQLCESTIAAGRDMYSSTGDLDLRAMRTALRQEILQMSVDNEALDSDAEKIQALIDTVIVALEPRIREERSINYHNSSKRELERM